MMDAGIGLAFITLLLLGSFLGTGDEGDAENDAPPVEDDALPLEDGEPPVEDPVAPDVVVPANVAATINGDASGAVIENAAATLTDTGQLTVIDPDAGQAVFQVQTGTVGTGGFGSFDLAADGTWTYSADNSNAAIQALQPGESLTDSFTALSADGTSQVVTVQILAALDPLELSALQSNADTSGFVINGVSVNDYSGISVSGAGDVNGDGFDDLIVGARGDDPNGNLSSGASFVIFGKADGAAVELSALESSVDNSGFVINGVSAGDSSGTSVSSAGDVNGDGLDDLIVGANFDSPSGTSSGASFVVFGKADGAAVELSALESSADSTGFVINGVGLGDSSGNSVGGAGDVNGDGLGDLIVGANGSDSNGTDSGAGFVIFGKADGTAIELSVLQSSADSTGFAINGASAGDQAGISVSGAGDVNGDGFDDLIVGARYDDPNGNLSSGASFVIFGKTDGTAVDLSALQSSADSSGFVINGVNVADFSGGSVSSAGDVNGDGLDDLIVGARDDDPNGGASGASFVIFGKADGAAVELSALESSADSTGFVINGANGSDYAGVSVSTAGDVNGDGFDDLIVGAMGDDPNGSRSGASFVVFGKADGTAIELSALQTSADSTGFVINGVNGADYAGFSVSSAGDVNGDGFDDLIVGAPIDDPNGNTNSGASFVIFGSNSTGAVTTMGDGVDNALSGDTTNEVIFGAQGNDTLNGGGGTDRLSGGQGADRFVQTDLAGTATIIDFAGSEGDQLDVSAFGLTDFAAFQALLSAEGPGGHDTRITLDADTSIILEGIRTTELAAANVQL